MPNESRSIGSNGTRGRTARLDGRVAVITGGARGIGEGTARRFVAEGASVVVADVEVEAGTALAAELGERCRFVRTDVAQEQDIAAVVDAAVEWFGRLDVMFNNAGVMGASGSIARLRLDDVEATFAVDLIGPLLGMKHAARVMRTQRSGVILTSSSPAGLVGGLGPHAYSAAKCAVIGLTRSVAAELRPHGIRVNVIVPGATVSGMTAGLTTGDPADLTGAAERLSRTALMARPVLPEDIAGAAVYLASDDAALVTGCVLPVDAGMVSAPGHSPFATGEHEEPGVLGGRKR
jgi:NAD(P)-dependent dehydrogenase (short-subunit alcohol dehydrogenase family)